MRILHTSDWHIGKKLDNKSRIAEQRAVLYDISRVVKENGVDIVCVAGDIYDTYMPSAESETLFYDVMSEITKSGAQIIIISGNHDDPARLTASKAVSSLGGIYFAGAGLNNDFKTVNGDFRAKLVDYGDDYFIFEKSDEKVYFAALPYPTELRMKEKISDDESYTDKVKRYILQATEKADNLPVVLLAHIFMLGGQTSEGERPIDLGGVRILPPDVIPDNCVYTALGHLHKRQVVNKNRKILYSGSILQYSFDESGYEKSVTVFDVLDGSVQNLNVIKLKEYKELFRISAVSVDDAEEKIKDLDGYKEVTLTLDKPCGDEVKKFALKHPEVTVKLVFNGVESAVFGRKTLGDEDLFKQYYISRYGKEPDKRVLELYMSVMHDIEVDYET